MLSSYSKEHAIIKKLSENIKPIPIKRLLMILDMATHGEKGLNYDEFIECYENV